MQFSFGFLNFCVREGKVKLLSLSSRANAPEAGGFAEVNVVGENRDSHLGNKAICSSESSALRYVSHALTESALEIVQRSALVEVCTRFRLKGGAIAVYSEYRNIADRTITIDEASAFVCSGLWGGPADAEEIFLYRFLQGHHAECQPRKSSLAELGLAEVFPVGQRRIGFANTGSWSTKEELPQGILEYRGGYTMFQIESNASWKYEIGDGKAGEEKFVYLYLGGADGTHGAWSKTLAAGESYRTVTVALAFDRSLNGVIGKITEYRRAIAFRNPNDLHLPIIFNEYMHLSWDSPTEANTRKLVPTVAELGAEYYVIDCGWHNEEDGNLVYPYVGQWKESRARFPHGIRKTTDFIRAHGMKAGLWIEPEIVGYLCGEMLDYYDEECFLHRHGKRICVMGRYFLNFHSAKVRGYLNETVRRMVEDYGADYIKMDYNQDIGIGADHKDGFGAGLEADRRAYLDWIDSVTAAYPQVLIETCSSGGLRMDYCTLAHFTMVSTSDQTNYEKYPFVAANVLSAVLPEQAAVWSYPVAGYGAPGDPFDPDFDWVEAHIGREQVVMNAVNAMLGRMHLAGHAELLRGEKLALVKEGIAFYKSLTPFKRAALPIFPLGFTRFGRKNAVCGLKKGNTVFLCVWNLGGTDPLHIPLSEEIETCETCYPKGLPTDFSFAGNVLSVRFSESYQARCFMLVLRSGS